MILIVCAAGDDHVAAVEPELTRRGVSVVRFDLADLPARAELSVAYEENAPARVVLRVRDGEFDLRAVSAVWSRRPQVPAPDPEIANSMIRHYVSQETADVWIGASALLECPWLPAPRWQELRASYKPLQLQVAADLGFQIPSTLMTNSPRDFLDFHRRHNGTIVSKTVHNRLLPVDAVGCYDAYVLTESVANRNVADVDAVRYCPVTVQPYVEKRVELRITVVGDRIFPVQIDSQWTHHTRHDWRRGDPHHTRFAVHDLPRDVERRSVELVKQLGLRFGAIDLILTPDGRYVFLEINPNGSWLAMERTTGLPIAAAIADLLAGNEVKSVPALPARAVGQMAADACTQPAAPALASSVRPTRRAGRIPQTAVADVLKHLARVTHARTPPDEAMTGLRRLAKRHRGTGMDLVWEVERCLGAVHYDALLRIPGGATISLAYTVPAHGVPWALRQAHHARESDLLRVNGRTLTMQTVMGYLDGLWHDARLMAALVDGCLVREAVDARGIQATDNEVRRANEKFERRESFADLDARNAWLRRRGWTPDDLDHEIRRQVIALKLRKQIAKGRIDSYFARRQRELDAAVVARLRVASGEAAERVAAQAATMGFDQAVEQAVQGTEIARNGPEFVSVRRRDLPPAYADAVFAALPGQVFGPFERDGGYDVVRVLRVDRARLDEATRTLITALLFEEWLEERRAGAAVEWFWGDVERAAGSTSLFGRRR